MAVQVSTKQILTFEARDGSVWRYRPMKAFERLAWETINRESARGRIGVWRDPIEYCVIHWENVKDSEGNAIEFTPGNQKMERLENAPPETLFSVSLKIIGDSQLTKEDVKNSSSAPSDSAEN